MRIAKSITVVLLGCLCGVSVEAQQNRIEIPAIKVLDEQSRSYRVGEALRLNLSYQDLKRVGGASKLQVRIFKASREALLNRFKNLAPDGCVIYPSRLYKAREYDGGIKILTTSDRPGPVILTESWLAASGKQVFDQEYLLVFERSGETEEILKLREQDVVPYFGVGFAFVVKAPTRPLKGMKVETLERQEIAAQAQAYERIKQQIVGQTRGPRPESMESKVPCKTFFRLEFERVARLLPASCGCPMTTGGQVAALPSLLPGQPEPPALPRAAMLH